jgi:rhamnosyltransferase
MPSPTRKSTVVPRIAVLLATHNGRRWLPQQLDSILDQAGVAVRVFALDDASTDGTAEWLAERAATEPRLTVLPSQGRAGSAAANFYRLLVSAPVDDNELVTFADQDDIWLPGKLARHARLAREEGYDGVSSNVTSFTPSGTRTLIRKSFPQREYDYLLESPGPGSTFLMSLRLVELVRELLADEGGVARSVDYHDWLVYAVARARGWSWHIDETPSVDYRQHDDNAMGANVGARSAASRLRLIREHWHRNQAALLARIGVGVAGDSTRMGLERMLELLTARGIRARWALARQSGQLRRRRRDQWIIALLIATGVW